MNPVFRISTDGRPVFNASNNFDSDPSSPTEASEASKRLMGRRASREKEEANGKTVKKEESRNQKEQKATVVSRNRSKNSRKPDTKTKNETPPMNSRMSKLKSQQRPSVECEDSGEETIASMAVCTVGNTAFRRNKSIDVDDGSYVIKRESTVVVKDVEIQTTLF